jgi:hypothetical protein
LGLDAALELFMQPLDGVRNRYEDCGAYLVRLGSGLILAYGATIRDKGHREHALWVGRRRMMSCELVLVAGRPCDLPGCAVSAECHPLAPVTK